MEVSADLEQTSVASFEIKRQKKESRSRERDLHSG